MCGSATIRRTTTATTATTTTAYGGYYRTTAAGLPSAVPARHRRRPGRWSRSGEGRVVNGRGYTQIRNRESEPSPRISGGGNGGGWNGSGGGSGVSSGGYSSGSSSSGSAAAAASERRRFRRPHRGAEGRRRLARRSAVAICRSRERRDLAIDRRSRVTFEGLRASIAFRPFIFSAEETPHEHRSLAHRQ